ncbi:thiolase C-terminal domain-containing protein [Pseudonocardia kunmingensis]|uniref:Acetyl-CoA acetyltransferase n=1 Tax=Pseudonocardia kunmingensis TaxID=630975 RepID=A0A543DPI2_9PSEU|nr:thiolase [Pseudonocardia kunmingensis]TQM11242.1 acetyl-CoA acetyltransferase [Pseudonocardia kunmingensis]
MTGSVTGTAVIAGAAESARIGVVPDESALRLGTGAALAALRDAGLGLADVDGVASTLQTVELAHHLGVRPRWLDGTNVGGCSYMLHVRHAVAALRTGQASVVLVVHGQSGRSRVGESGVPPGPSSVPGQFERPYGVAGTFSLFTLPAMAYLSAHGLGEAELAEVPVAQSRWASRNPRALRPGLLTVDDVLSSKTIAWPFRVLECCPLTDGGGALVLTTAERAADLALAHPAVVVAGSGEACEGPGPSFMDDLTTFRGFRDASAEALREAGVSTDDVDHLMVYDAYAHLPLYGLEDIGFVGKGEAAEFIRSGATSPGGALPMNTNGGGLLYTHTGMYGMFALQEAVRQLQGRAAAQVPDVRTSLVQGVGGMFAAAGTVVLQRS